MLVLKLLMLLVIANGTPVILKKVLADRFATPLDGGAVFIDGRRLFGPSKTIRGVLSAVLATTLGAMVMGYDWRIGAVVGGASMTGDLFSSFIKRRLNMPCSSMALGLDQVPESLFPLLVVQFMLPVTVTDMVTVVVAFFITELLMSLVLFRLHIRDKPY
jgi:CDP-diglyceride synthetase